MLTANAITFTRHSHSKEPLRRVTVYDTGHDRTLAFSNFTERIRVCLNYYLSLGYVCNSISQGTKRIILPPLSLFARSPDLFSG